MTGLAVLVFAGLFLAAPPDTPPQLPPPPPPVSGRQAPPAPARDARTAPAATGTGVISGRVVAADTGEPLRHARVSVSAPQLRTARSAASDLDGRFEFRNLPPGRFSVTAEKVGYVTLAYGQKRPFQQAVRVELAPAQSFDARDLALPRGAIIAGRVTNDLGEPAQGTRVFAYRLKFQNGRREVVPAGRYGEADDLGQFRVCNLPPGSYYVGTAATGASSDSGVVAEEGFALGNAFYPGVAQVGEGKLVTVRLGQEVGGIDFPLLASRASTISGTVSDSRGRVSGSPVLMIRQVGRGMLELTSTRLVMAEAGGRFTIGNVLPGDYTIHGSATNPDSGEEESAEVPVSVGNADVSDVAIVTAPMGRLAGRVGFDGEAQPAFAPSSLTVTTAGSPLGSSPAVHLGTGWAFDLKGVEPGRQQVSIEPIPAGWAIKDITSNGRSVIDAGVDISSATTTTIDITLTDKVTSLTGTVKAAAPNQPPPSEYTVLVFSDDPSHWKDRSRRIAIARPELGGSYKVVGLPQGVYRAIALEYVDDGEQQNPEFLAWARSRAARIELADGASATLDLTLVKYGNQ